MATIGGQTFFSVNWAAAEDLQAKMRDITAPAALGRAYIEDGIRAEPVRLLVRTHIVSGTFKGFMDTYQAMVRTVVTIVDDFGDTHSNYLVHRVTRLDAQVPHGGNPPNIIGVLQTEWLVEKLI